MKKTYSFNDRLRLLGVISNHDENRQFQPSSPPPENCPPLRTHPLCPRQGRDAGRHQPLHRCGGKTHLAPRLGHGWVFLGKGFFFLGKLWWKKWTCQFFGQGGKQPTPPPPQKKRSYFSFKFFGFLTNLTTQLLFFNTNLRYYKLPLDPKKPMEKCWLYAGFKF